MRCPRRVIAGDLTEDSTLACARVPNPASMEDLVAYFTVPSSSDREIGDKLSVRKCRPQSSEISHRDLTLFNAIVNVGIEVNAQHWMLGI